MARKKEQKIIRYRKPININIGMVIFAFLFLYLIIIGVLYLTRDHVQMYRVTEGSLSGSTRYTGLIVRSEEVTSAENSGYVNFYLREGSKAGVGTLVYSLDENGTATEKLSQLARESGNLTEDRLSSLRTRLSQYSSSYDPMRFSDLYDVSYDLRSSLMEYVNQTALEELMRSLDGLGSYFSLKYAQQSGLVVYSTDGYEDWQETDVKKADFDRSGYQRTAVRGGQLIEGGKPVYKTITSYDWDVLFQISDADAAAFDGKSSVTVRFPDTGIRTSAGFSTFVGADEKVYGRLTLDDYLVRYADLRYTDIELIPDTPSGLKIPVSSIVHKDFYVIPVSFLATGGNSNESGFYREVYENGQSSVVFETPSVYYQNDEFVFVEKTAFSDGDNLVRPDSTEQYKIGPTQSLTGVYNVSRGYAVFRHVKVLARNEEYAIVAQGTRYGLSANDHIALDGLALSEDEIIY